MDIQEREVFERVLAAFEVNPRDWLTVKDVSRKTGISAELVEPTLRKHPEMFEQAIIIGVPAYTLARSWRVPSVAASR